MTVSRNAGGIGRFEPEVTRTFLPGCRVCGGSHPLARRGYQGPSDHCPDCELPVASPGPTLSDRATLPGIAGVIANTLLGIGRWIGRLAREI